MATAVDSHATHLPRPMSASRTSDGKNEEDQGELDICPDSRNSRDGGSLESNAREESTASYLPSTKMLERHMKDETLLAVKIRSFVEESNFCLPVSLIVDRELEMRKTAQSFGIESSRWTKSRLFREWRDQIDNNNLGSSNANTPTTPEIRIVLDPENDFVSSNQSHSFTWEPWLTTCIRAYYNTGKIRIPDKCSGSDILLALEYFGILYSPEQLVFESFGGYLRVKMWSDYFTHRARLADWVLQRVLTKSPPRHSHSFVTSPYMQEELFHLLSNKPIDVLDGDLVVDPSRCGDSLSSRAIVHELFNDEDEGSDDNNDNDEKMDGLMREDFCSFVQASLPGTNVSFSLKMVTTSREETVRRAVLRVTLATKSSLASEDRKMIGSDIKEVSRMATTSSLNGSLVLSTPTASTQPLTPSTFGDLGVDLPQASLSRAHVLRRCQTEKSSARRSSVLDHVYDDKPHDDFTPTQTPHDASSWRHDDPSVDNPRETIRYSTEMVRSLSEKIIRKTIADMDVMDTIDHGLTPIQDMSFSSKMRGSVFNSHPSDETGHGLELSPRWKNGAIDDCAKRNLLPTLDLENDYDHARGHHVQDKFDPLQTSHGQVKSYQNPPMGHVNINHVKSCDEGTVTSALSNPTFDETRHTINGPSVNRQLSTLSLLSTLSTLSDFRTTVDAFSATDEQSVQIEVPEETTRVVRGRPKYRTHNAEEENIYPKKTQVARAQPKYKVHKAEEDESMDSACASIGSGVFGASYEMFCKPGVKSSGGKVRKNYVKQRGKKDSPSEGTLRTEEESDENNSQEGDGELSRCRNKTEQFTCEDAICSLGDMATTLIDGIFENLGVLKICDNGCNSKRKSPKRRGASKKRHMVFGDDWDRNPREREEEDDDAAAEIISKISIKTPPTTPDSHSRSRKNSRNHGRKFLPPRPIDRSQSRRPVRTAVRPQAHPQVRSKVQQEGMEETEFDRIQDILKKAERPVPHSKKISVSVMRNLQLLNDSRGPELGDFGETERIASVDKKLPTIKIIPTGNDGNDVRDKNRGSRKGLLGFFRKK